MGLEKTLAFNLSGHVLHSIFWKNLYPDGGDKPDGELARAVDEHFGSFDSLRTRLTAATTSVQGSGWGVLGYEPVSGRLIIEQLNAVARRGFMAMGEAKVIDNAIMGFMQQSIAGQSGLR